MELVELENPLDEKVEFDCDRIRSTDQITKQPAILLIDGVAKLTKGNISAWKGVAKSKKTFALTLAGANVLKGDSLHEKFKPVSTGELAWFDTEQSPFDAQLVTKRLIAMAGNEEKLWFYGLRRYSPKVRVSKIEAFLTQHGAVIDILVIDGIRDLLMDFNDPVESSELITKLMAWTIDYDLHISTVLHANKGDGHMRGHLGTELQNKSETVFSVVKHEHINDCSIVEEEFGRGRNIKPFSIIINGNGLPEIMEGEEDEDKDAPF